MDSSEPGVRYAEGAEREAVRVGELEARSGRLSLARSVVFLAGVGCLVLADPLEGSGEPVALVLGALLTLVFVLLVRRHRTLRREIGWHETLRELHELGTARLERDWYRLERAGLPSGPAEAPSPHHPYAPDLHLFGRHSLFRLAGPVTTAPGRRTLGEWFTSPARVDVVRERQEAVAALAGQMEIRHELAALGMVGPGAEREGAVRALIRWAEEPSWLDGERSVRAAAFLLPPATIGFVVLDLTGGAPLLWALPLALQLLAFRRVRPRIADEVDRISVGAPVVERYAGQLGLLSRLPRSPLLDRIREEVGPRATASRSGSDEGERSEGDAGAAPEALRSLRRRLDWAESRGNMFYQALNWGVLLDVHVYRALERWKSVHGGRVAPWLQALGATEALSALATLAFDHPSWDLPEVVGEGEGDGRSSGREDGSEDGSRDGSEGGTENGPEIGSKNGSGRGPKDVVRGGAEDGSEDGAEDGSRDVVEDGAEIGSENAAGRGTEDGSEDGTEEGPGAAAAAAIEGVDGPRLVAHELGHPLLPPGECVGNDVEIGPPESFLLVTGSNMSGKSTLLRAVGANVVLALAGGPVCAERMLLPEVRLWTSMKVNDSLEEGVSRFMAELLRLKEIVHAARETRTDEAPVLYLLDEVLHGTNSAERRVAVRTVLRHLLDAGAIGAVTSHDLTLHRAEDLERRTRAFHFRESVERREGRPVLHFDYRLRPGPATTTNALELLEAVGLGEEEGDG